MATGRPKCEHPPVHDHADRSPASVYEMLSTAVFGYFRAQRMRDPEDLTGDVFVAVTQKLSGFRGDDAALRRWVFTIAHHRRVDEIRRSARQPEILDDAPLESPSFDPAPIDPALVAALDRLTIEQRDVVVLRYLADLSIADVAKIIGKRPGAVKMLQARGLDALADAVGNVSRPEA